MLLEMFLLLVGFAALIKGADLLVDGASSTAKKLGVSNLAIGLTVVAFGTSMPELVVSFLAAMDGKNDASFGNIVGSNNFNLLFILGIAGLIYPLAVHRNTVKWEVPMSLLAAVALYVLVNDMQLWGTENILGRVDSIILLVLFGGFLYYIYVTMKMAPEMEESPIKVFTTPVATGMIVLGLVALIFGGQLVVTNAISMAQRFGLSEKLIGLTILAAGTSLPELATSCVAAYRKNTDIAIGNVVGSNIFNILFILGVTGLVHPIPYNTAMNFDMMVLGASTILLMVFMFTLNTRKLDRWEAFLMLGAYITYVLVLVQRD
jgi:cation:H+ antiporter